MDFHIEKMFLKIPSCQLNLEKHTMNNPNRLSKNSNTEPSKGILRGTQDRKSVKKGDKACPTCSLPTTGRAHFDEMNILQTFHPENKDYGHMKIDEANTPYNKYEEPVDGKKQTRGSVNYSQVGPIDPTALSSALLSKQATPLKSSVLVKEVTNDEDVEQEKAFKAKRAAHYTKEFVKKDNPPSQR